MSALLCIGGIILIGGVYFCVYALCCVAARADTYQLHALEQMERENKPKVTGEL